VAPVFKIEGVTYISIKKGQLYLLISTRYNISAPLAIEFLERVAQLIKDYCGGVTEDIVRRNFTLIYEILDEVVDYGHPQETAAEKVKVFVFNSPAPLGSVAEQAIAAAKGGMARLGLKNSASIDAKAVTRSVLTKDDPKAANEVFLDVLEKISVCYDMAGTLLHGEINGSIVLKSFLKGNSPQLNLALNEDLAIGNQGTSYGKAKLDDVNFHDCVRLDQWERERLLVIFPPDGECSIMNYRISEGFRPPFKIYPFIDEQSANRFELTLKIACEVPATHFGSNVVIKIPIPQSAETVNGQLPSDAEGESWEYKQAEKCVYWSVKKFMGMSEHAFKLRSTLDSHVKMADALLEIGPISMAFEIPMHNTSDLEVKYLRVVDNSGSTKNPPNRWVRYISQSDSYACRC